jgi:hypothetical protein
LGPRYYAHFGHVITYSKGRCGRLSWSFFHHVTRPSIHSSILSSIHGWHHTGKKTLAEINNSPPLAHVSLSRKGMPDPRGSDINIKPKGPKTPWHWTTLGYICHLRTFTMVSYMLLSHGSQAMQTSRFSATRVPMNTCEMW